MSATLDVAGLAKHYRGHHGIVRALDGVDVTVEPGELVVVQGPSGCGKTTLLLAAGGLLRPTSGCVLIAGQDPYELSPPRRAAFRAANVGFVFQQFHLIPYLSVLDNVLTPSLAQPFAGSVERADVLIEALGLSDRRLHAPAALSTGERQRVALARALLNRPRIVLADEPTGNLDPANAAIVLEQLAAFSRTGGAVLLVTHDATAAAAASRVITLRAGHVASLTGDSP